MMRISSQRSVTLAALSFGLSVLIFIVSSGSAKAAYSDITPVLPEDPTSRQFINLTNTVRPDSSEPGTGSGALAPASYFKVYGINGTEAHRIEFDVVNRRVGDAKACYNYKIGWGVTALDSYGVIRGGYQGGAR